MRIFFINIFMRKIFLALVLCTSVTPAISEPVNIASAMVGMNEQSDRSSLKRFMGIDPTQYAWCAAFVNAILHLYGIPGSETVSEYPLTARSFLRWGEEVFEPQKGDVVIFPRGREGWQGHVGFYIETQIVDGVENYLILGGNQNDSVSYDLYPADKALGIRRFTK